MSHWKTLLVLPFGAPPLPLFPKREFPNISRNYSIILVKGASFIMWVSTSTTDAEHLRGCRRTRSRTIARERWRSLSKTDKAGKTAKKQVRGDRHYFVNREPHKRSLGFLFSHESNIEKTSPIGPARGSVQLEVMIPVDVRRQRVPSSPRYIFLGGGPIKRPSASCNQPK